VLDNRQLTVCELMATGIPTTEVAAQSGVARSTIYEWKKLEEFKAELDRLGQDFIFSMQASGRAYAPKAMAKLIYLCENGTTNKTQLDAASKIIDKYMSNATKIEVTDGRDDKDNVPVDVLDQELKEFDEE